MKRMPMLLSLFALVALSASIAYWVLQFYQPAQRPLAAAAAPTVPEPAIDAAATLFGGQLSAAVASNYQLTGVVAAGRESVAIIVADNGQPKALKLGKEVSSGVTVQEVHPRYVMLSDGGVLKRIDLAVDNKAASGVPASPLAGQQQFQPQPQPQQFQPQPIPPPAVQVPSMQGQPQPAAPPPPAAPIQMPQPSRTQEGPAQLQ